MAKLKDAIESLLQIVRNGGDRENVRVATDAVCDLDDVQDKKLQAYMHDLGYMLTDYEPNPDWRAQCESFFGDETLQIYVRKALNKLIRLGLLDAGIAEAQLIKFPSPTQDQKQEQWKAVRKAIDLLESILNDKGQRKIHIHAYIHFGLNFNIEYPNAEIEDIIWDLADSICLYRSNPEELSEDEDLYNDESLLEKYINEGLAKLMEFEVDTKAQDERENHP
jgi:hypothetical protein